MITGQDIDEVEEERIVKDVYDQVYEALNNAVANDYPHDYDRNPMDYVLEIDDWSGIVGFESDKPEHVNAGHDAVTDWRKAHQQ